MHCQSIFIKLTAVQAYLSSIYRSPEYPKTIYSAQVTWYHVVRKKASDWLRATVTWYILNTWPQKKASDWLRATVTCSCHVILHLRTNVTCFCVIVCDMAPAWKVYSSCHVTSTLVFNSPISRVYTLHNRTSVYYTPLFNRWRCNEICATSLQHCSLHSVV